MNILSFFKKSNNSSSGIFVPKEDGFAELSGLANASINDIGKFLGYDTEMTHTYLSLEKKPSTKIEAVVYEIFTSNIIFILTSKDVLKLRPSVLYEYTKDFDIKEQFSAVTTEDILNEGIANRSLASNYLSRVLNLSDIVRDGILNSDILGLYLHFSNGFLVDYQSSDGLSSWAKELRQINPKIINDYQKEAEHYWSTKDFKAVANEINAQADAFADLPSGVINPLCSLHKTPFGNINFVNLLVAHYEKEIHLDDFLLINKGRFEKIEDYQFRVGKFLYEFDINGHCFNATQIS